MNIVSNINAPVEIDGVVIHGKGAQTLTDDEAKIVTAHPIFHDLVANGAISEGEAEEHEDPVTPLKTEPPLVDNGSLENK